jgi:transposase-like protein
MAKKIFTEEQISVLEDIASNGTEKGTIPLIAGGWGLNAQQLHNKVHEIKKRLEKKPKRGKKATTNVAEPERAPRTNNTSVAPTKRRKLNSATTDGSEVTFNYTGIKINSDAHTITFMIAG